MKKVYLATCYSWGKAYSEHKWHKWWAKPWAWVMQGIRKRRVTKATANLIAFKDVNVFSPITHSHSLPKYIPDRLNTYTVWLDLDFQWIDCCDELWVYCQPGWKDSYGVQKEIVYALRKDIPVKYIHPQTYEFVTYIDMLPNR